MDFRAVSNRSMSSDARAHAMSRKAMEEATLGLVIITRKSFSNLWSIEELNILLPRKNLIPIFFGLMKGQCLSRNIVEKKGDIWSKYGGELWKKYNGREGEWIKAVDGLSRLDVMLEVSIQNMRDCVLDAIHLIGKKLGRRDSVEKLMKWKSMAEGKEFPFARNSNFTGRKNEFLELKLMLFGDGEIEGDTTFFNLIPQRSCRSNIELHQKKNRGRMKEQRMWKESKEEIELECEHN
ncbi:hypothetical protein KSP40_PGU001268 [Platanthera guangdongensis]|uniref:TIR domain-containing protein n=1 Tax=Platanthera guangdongensis TaxID=2320717 RepID=A0ABR2LZ03_9ASPA